MPLIRTLRVKDVSVHILALMLIAGLGACGKSDPAAQIKEAALVGPSCPADAGDYADDTKISKTFNKLLASPDMKQDYTPVVLQLHSEAGKAHACVTWAGIVITASKGLKLRLAPQGVKGEDSATQARITKVTGVEELDVAQMLSYGDTFPLYFQASGPDSGGTLKVTGNYFQGADQTHFKLSLAFKPGTPKVDILRDDSTNTVSVGFGDKNAPSPAASGTDGGTGSASSSGSGSGAASGSAASASSASGATSG